MDALAIPRHRIVRPTVAAVVATMVATAAVATEPEAGPPPFKPGEISIGEPIALPLGTAGASVTAPAAAAPAADTKAASPAPQAAAGAVPGSGWLGLSVAESTVPGRWRVEDVAPAGPAARAGIAPGDELRAVNGAALANADEVAQALTAISAGQDVRVAVARADRVSDLVLRAEPRPAPQPAEPSRFATPPAAVPVPPLAATPAPTLARTSAPPDPQPVAAPPAGIEWQASPSREPDPPAGSRFGPRPAVPTPAPVPPTAAPAAGFASPSGFATPTPGPPPAPVSGPPAAASPPGRIALGVRTVPIDPATQARFQLREPSGAYVVGVVQDLPAAKAGVPPGSVIVALGGEAVRSPQELTRLVTRGPVDKPVTVQFVLPGGEAKQAAVVLQSLDVPLERALIGAETGATPPPTLPSNALPRRAERPTVDEGAVRAEIRVLRSRLERLEQLLFDPAARRPR